MRLSKNDGRIFENNYDDKKGFFTKDRKSLEVYRTRDSLLSNKYERRKLSVNNSFINYNKNKRMNYSQIVGYNTFDGFELDYKGIEKEIQNVIHEMKNNCLLEIRRQSCDELQLFKNKLLKDELKNDLIFTNIESLKKREINPQTQINNKIYMKKGKKIRNSGNIDKKKLKQNKTINDKFELKKYTNKNIVSFLEKFRFYGRGGVIEDSFDESESDEGFEEEEDNFLINPETKTFLIYDTIIFFASFYSLIFAPYEITTNCFCKEKI